jgi:methionine-rich copper-binding protein CopC
MSRTNLTLSLAACAFFAFSSAAFAHAHLHNASPADKAEIAAPTELDLSFTEELNPAFSGVTLLGPDGKEVKLGDAALMEGNKMMMAPIPTSLKPGSYTVNWHVLSSDGHKSSGSYGFTVKP